MPGENLPGERIESLVDELESIIEESRPPFGKTAQFKVIETDVFFNILEEVRMSYPEEWQRSRRILKERDELLASAAAQADSIIADAQQQALTIAGEQEIVRLAQQQADEIRDRANQYERETRYAAEDYAEQVFTHLEENLKSLANTVSRCRQQLNEGAGQQQNGAW
ncbi:ATPase [Collinsella sp. AGMB00827]|uniref:ATPase n=1 Tax=Collinsella ureilytica TaxID=2869515 RepID=A0ABS7MHJ0_9ACTN|nr:ATPase [Collinsella urealyticum]MBY4796818.1 ATPase [Collinsella urealyticum]